MTARHDRLTHAGNVLSGLGVDAVTVVALLAGAVLAVVFALAATTLVGDALPDMNPKGVLVLQGLTAVATIGTVAGLMRLFTWLATVPVVEREEDR